MSDEILVINTGSSSLKFSLFACGAGEPSLTMSGQVEAIGTAHSKARVRSAAGDVLLEKQWSGTDGPADCGTATARILEWLGQQRPGWKPAGVGHRVVHGGTRFVAPQRIDADVRAALEALVPLVPLHAPANLAGIDAATRTFPGVPQIACFDTAFHAGRPFVADAFALPREWYDAGVRRFGFHGLSFEYIVRAMRREAPQLAEGNLVVAHLGNGSSLCAIRNGKCLDTTMGLTPLDGLPMGTRCGQIDPGVLLYFLQEKKLNPVQLAELLYKHSGLLGLSGVSSDMRDLLASDNAAAREAVDYFVYRVTGYIGNFAAALGGIDALIFTGGIGENSAEVRERVCKNLSWLGLQLNEDANRSGQGVISTVQSKVVARVERTNEELMIALHVLELLDADACK